MHHFIDRKISTSRVPSDDNRRGRCTGGGGIALEGGNLSKNFCLDLFVGSPEHSINLGLYIFLVVSHVVPPTLSHCFVILILIWPSNYKSTIASGILLRSSC